MAQTITTQQNRFPQFILNSGNLPGQINKNNVDQESLELR